MASNDDLLFAEHAVKGGYLNEAQVRESLGVQERMAEMGVHESLRNVLVKRGVIREGDAALVSRAAGLRSGREPIPGYTLRARVGSGAMGSVYRAHQRAMKRDVAIKILRRDLTDDPRQVERLQREATLVGTLDHPNIVRGLDCGESDGLVYFVMEFVEGRTLHRRIRDDGPLTPEDAISITLQMAQALEHAHGHGVVHRDIKPGNILLTEDDEPRLTDYGLAKGESDDALTQLDATLGTPQYIAPEQARNPRDVDVRSDIYSLGATLYAMLAGRPPFQAESLAATLTKVLYDRPTPIAEAAPDTPPELAYVVERMMAKDRRHRYPSPEDLVRDLRALEAGRLHVPVGFRGDIEAFVETRRQRRVWMTGAAILTVAVLAAIGTSAWQAEQDRQEAQRLAQDDLAAILTRPGDRVEWDGGTVSGMLDALEGHLAAHPEAATQVEAREELRRWQRQRDAIEGVQELQKRASKEGEPDWPRLLSELRAELTRLSRDGEADVARRRLQVTVAEVEQARDRRAREILRLAREESGKGTFLDSAARFEGVAGMLRDRIYGPGPAPEADAAEALAAEFRDARRRLDAQFAEYERASRGAELLTADLRALEKSLLDTVFAAEDDEELVALLNGLPPTSRTWRDEIIKRHENEMVRLRDASHRRLRDAQSEAKSMVDDRQYVDAEAWVDAAAKLLLGEERDQLVNLRREIETERLRHESDVAMTTAEAERELIDALRRRDYRHAEIALDDLEVLTAGWANEDGPSQWLVDQGRALVSLIRERAWEALRSRLASGRPLERGLQIVNGIRYQGVRDLRVSGDHVTFAYEGGPEPLKIGLYEVDLEDVLHYSGLPGVDPQGAMVTAALRMVSVPEDLAWTDPREAEDEMRHVAPLLENARRARGFEYLVERFDDRRRTFVVRAGERLAGFEREAQLYHDEAKRALADGRYDIARSKLEKLLKTDDDMRKTQYVRDHYDEVVAEHARSLEGGETARYAAALPGTRLEDGDGRATLTLDFEHPDAADAFRADPTGGGIVVRREITAALPGMSGDAFPVVENRVFAWSPWSGRPETHPRHYPFSMDVPFNRRRRIDVSFLYRSDAPFFLQISIGGTAVGVLSAGEVREAGRGVAIWQSPSLDGVDTHFGERHRAEYLERHPEVLDKEGDTRFLSFEPGRLYRLRFVKDERKATLYVDGRRVLEEDLRPGVSGGDLTGKVFIGTHTSGEIDDVRVSGVLDPDWLKGRR